MCWRALCNLAGNDFHCCEVGLSWYLPSSGVKKPDKTPQCPCCWISAFVPSLVISSAHSYLQDLAIVHIHLYLSDLLAFFTPPSPPLQSL